MDRVHRRGLICGLALLLNPQVSAGATFTLPQLDTSQIGPIFEVLATTTIFRSLEPPSHPGRFGFWINARVDITSATTVANIFGSNTNGSYLPFGNAQMGVYLPAGFGLEFGMIPSTTLTGTTFYSYGGAVRWTPTQFLKASPVDLTAKAFYGTSGLNFNQTISGVPLTVDYSNSEVGFGVDVGRRLFIFEPYIGLSVIRQSSSIAGSGNVSLFGNTFPVNTQTVSATGVSTWFRAGLEIKLIILTLGVQYDVAYGIDTYSGKIGFKF